MKKICEKCGNKFDAKEDHFKLCPTCFSSLKIGENELDKYLLKNYYDQNGHPLKEVYLEFPKKLVNIFIKSSRPLTIKQLREVHRKILKAKIKAMLKGIEAARHILYECQRDLEYQLKRGVIPDSFVKFMNHHLSLAEKDEKSLNGFFQHLDSIVCYFPIKK